jgi:hypothetical protein
MPSPTPANQVVVSASLAVVTGKNGQTGDRIAVHFNPASLQLQVSNELKDTRNQERKQYIAKTTAKLTMDLQFDTTDTGEDVTTTTRKLQAFLAPPSPPGASSKKQIPPPLVVFEWGTLLFKGIAENYKETIDFFSANGVPLRASVNLTLSRQDQVFDDPPPDAPKSAGPMDADLALDTPATSPADAASGMDAPGAARVLAAANGQENLRFGDGSLLTVSGQITLKPPAAFAAGAALSLGGGIGGGVGVGAGIGLGASAGFGVSGGAGLGFGTGASAGFGVSASVGVAGMARLSATQGAFNGLRVSTSIQSAVRLDPTKLVPKIISTTLPTDAGAKFQVGGKASFGGSAGLRADVGVAGKLIFDAR